ncbi:uncharacterized protein [Fopius arisanus]|uniref:PHO1-H2 protein n=1 Tax=Fopius arisanus TaxID=64838 RepID=A0A0C9RLG4_9HYME|nr:PREDICTED: uncharacterized protein LOC105265736 [Fopius arisanus]
MSGLLAVGLIALMTVSVRSEGILDCLYQDDSLECGRKTADAALDKIELEATGRKSPPSFSEAIEETAGLFVEGVQTILGTDADPAERQVDTGNREARLKLFLKKKKKLVKFKKLMLKMIPFIMLMKAKISLMLQMISTHFQSKFFIIGIISILINGARLFLELKKNHNPGKVIYYSSAEHQHHYDHDDEGNWRRSVENVGFNPQEKAYSAHLPNY